MGIVAFNAASQMTALGAILIIQVIYMIFVARMIGPEDFGRFSFAWSLVQIFLMAGDLGLHNTAIREISGNLKISPLLGNSMISLKSVLSCVLFLIMCVIGLLVGDTEASRISLAVFGFGMLLHSIAVALNVLYQAHGRLYLASLNMLLLFACQLIFGVSALMLGGGLVSLGLAYVMSSFLALVTNVILFRRLIHEIQWHWPTDWISFFRRSFPVGLSNFFSATSSRISIALLVLLAGPLSTGLFAAAFRFVMASGNVPQAVMSAVLPVFAAHQSDSRSIASTFRKALLILSLAAVGAFGAIYYFAEPLVRLIYGSQYLESIGILKIIVWAILPIFVGMVFSSVLLSQSHLVGRLPWINGFGLLLNTLLCLLLIPRWGAIGAAYSLLAVDLLLAICFILFSGKFLIAGTTPEVSTE